MPKQPTALQIRERAERRCAELGITEPSPGDPSFEAKQRLYDERFDRQLADAEGALTRAFELEAERKAKRDQAAQRAQDAHVDQLRRAYMEMPGATVAGFKRALPDLFEQQWRDAALSGQSRFKDQLVATRRRLGSVI
jgi:hypothetical protein